MIPSIVKTKYFGKKNNSYLPIYAHTTIPSHNDKKGRKVTVYRLGKTKLASKYSGPLYSPPIKSKTPKKSTKKSKSKSALLNV